MRLSLIKIEVDDVSNTIKIDTSALDKVMKGLQGFEKEVPAAVQQAVNRTVNHVFTKAAQIVTKHYNITNREVKETMTKRKASRGSLNAFVRLRGKRFTLGRFLPGGLSSSSKVAKVKVKKKERYKHVGGEPKAFAQQVTGRTQVMRRMGDKRYPVDVLRTIATAQMVKDADVENSIQEAARVMLDKRITHEIDRRLRKAGRL